MFLFRVADRNFFIYREQLFPKSVEMSVEGETGQQFKDAGWIFLWLLVFPENVFFIFDEAIFSQLHFDNNEKLSIHQPRKEFLKIASP